MTVSPSDYFVVSNIEDEELACAPGVVTYGDGNVAVVYLADETNSVETEASSTIVVRLGLFNVKNPSDEVFVDIASANQELNEITIGSKAPYEPNILKLSDELLLITFTLRDNSNNYVYYGAKFDTVHQNVVSYEPLTLDGLNWTPSAVAKSYNMLSETDINASGPTSSMVFTSRIVEHEGYFYGFSGGVCNGFGGILVRSLDGINWTSVMVPEAVSEMKGVIECGYEFIDDVVYFCMRDISSGIYHTSYKFSTKEQLTEISKLASLTTSKPATFIQDDELYLIVNKATGDDNTVGRRNTAQFYRVEPATCELSLVKQVFCADGIAYHNVININGKNQWFFHTDARRINPYTQGRSNLAMMDIPAFKTGTYIDDSGRLDIKAYDYLLEKGCITQATNQWVQNAVNLSYQIPLTGLKDYDSVTITANQDNKAFVAFFTKKMIASGVASYASGWETQLILEAGQSETLIIPEDAQYLYIIATNAAGNSLVPESVVLNKAEQMTIRYDDHLDMTGKTVQIIDAGTPTSYQVGYGVEENTVLDSAVVTLVDNTLIATGIGSAKVSVDDVVYEITVETAPISLILLIGQSNMRGSEGDANQSIVCPDGMVYATFGDDRGDTEGIMNAKNATKFAASALTGQYSTINVEGTTEHLSYYPLNSLTEDGKGTIGPDSGFAYEWVKQTGEKVWIVNAAHGGTSITTWVENATNFKEADLLFSACQETLRKEIAAGHFSLSHMGYYWCQGCSDAGWTAEKYATTYLSMHESLNKNLTFDDDSNPATPDAELEFAGIIPVRAGNASSICYREGTYEVTTTAKYHESFKDLRMTGPRVAQYWMTNNPELEDIWLVCNIGEDWVTMPDGTNGVSSYFQKHYANGTVDYTPQVAQKTSWYTPTTPAAVHDSIHYNQIGYNEIGRESVRNTMVYLGINEPEETETTVEFVSWDGFSTISEMKAYKNPASGSLVVPMVSPVYKSKEVTYAFSEGLSYAYYDLLTESVLTTGALTASNGKTLSIKEKALSSYHWNLVDDAFVSATIYGDTENPLTLKSGSIENGTFSSVYYLLEDSVVLKHDKQWVIEWKIDGSKTNASGATLLSAAASTKDQEAYLYVRPNNSFVGVGYNNGTNGVNFGYSLLDYGYDVTDKHTYRLVNRVEDDGSNMIYLFVDGKEVGPLNREHKGSTQYIGESNWVSGQDFVFSYLGSSDYPVNGMTLNYLVVSENDTDDTVHFHNYT